MVFQKVLYSRCDQLPLKIKRNCLCFIDIDKFKPINDKYGHLVGDGVLIEIANRIQRALPKDFFGRLGGDEFIVILNQIENITDTVEIVERIQRTLSEE